MEKADINEIFKDLKDMKNAIANVGKIADVLDYLQKIERKIDNLQKDINEIKQELSQ